MVCVCVCVCGYVCERLSCSWVKVSTGSRAGYWGKPDSWLAIPGQTVPSLGRHILPRKEKLIQRLTSPLFPSHSHSPFPPYTHKSLALLEALSSFEGRPHYIHRCLSTISPKTFRIHEELCIFLTQLTLKRLPFIFKSLLASIYPSDVSLSRALHLCRR